MNYTRTLLSFSASPRHFAQRLSTADGQRFARDMTFLIVSTVLAMVLELFMAQVLGPSSDAVAHFCGFYIVLAAWAVVSHALFLKREIRPNLEPLFACYLYIFGTFVVLLAATRFVVFSATLLFFINLEIILHLALMLCVAWLMLMVGVLTNASRLYSNLVLISAAVLVATTIVTRL